MRQQDARSAYAAEVARLRKAYPRSSTEELAQMAASCPAYAALTRGQPETESVLSFNRGTTQTQGRPERPSPWSRWIADMPKGGPRWFHVGATPDEEAAVRDGRPVSDEMSWAEASARIRAARALPMPGPFDEAA